MAEELENRQLLSATSDGFVANFFGAQYTTVAQFPAPHTNAGDYSTHLDQVFTQNGTQSVAPPDAPSNFNPAAGGNGPGYQFSGKFSTNIVVQQTGWFTFYPTTDDGAQINLDGVPAGAQNLAAARGPTEDADPAPVQWQAGSTHALDFYFNNGGGGWDFELRWSATSAANGAGVNLIGKSLVSGTSAPAVATLLAPAPTLAPAAPTLGSSTTNSLTLNWSSHDVDAASFVVERSTGGAYTPLNASNPIASTNGGTVTYTDSGLTPGTQYSYKIVSNSIAGSTSPGLASEPTSPAAAFTTPTTNPPLAAPPVSVAAGAAGNVVTFGQVTNATTYNILRSTTVNGTYTQIGSVASAAGASTLSYTDANNNTNAFYKVQAVNTAVPTTDPGYSTNSGPATLLHGDGFGASYYVGDFNGGTTFSSTAVYSPTALAAAPTFSTIVPAINSGPQVQTNRPVYTPTSFNSANGAGPGATFSTEFDFTVVAPTSEKYTFLPRTDDGEQLTVDGTILDARGSGGAVTDKAVVPVTWTAGTTHTVQMAYYQGQGGWEADLGWTSPSLATLYPTGFYGSAGQVVPGFDAYARGVAPASNKTSPTVADPPVLSIGSSAGTNLALSFTASQAATYNVYRGTSSGGEGATPFALVAGSPGAQPGVATYSFVDSTLAVNTTYYYFVTAVDAAGTSASSNEISYKATNAGPSAPTSVTVAPAPFLAPLTLGGPGPSAVPFTVSWSVSQFATSYDVLRATVTGGTAGPFGAIATGLTATSYVDNTTAFNAQYQYEVVARNASNPTGSSPASTSAPSATTRTDQGALEEFYPNTQTWGGASDNADTRITGVVGNPSTSSLQPTINFNDASQSDLPPGGTPGTQGGTYSTIFTGKVHITAAGNYTFFSNTDDDGILYVDGALVAAGSAGTGNTNNGTVLSLSANSNYNFQFFQEQGAGGQRFQLLYNGPDTSNATNVVPQTALVPLSGAPATATGVAASVGAANAAGTTYPVTVTFNDVATNEVAYQLQRSTDAAFDGAGNVVTVAATGPVVNGTPGAGGAPAVGAGALTDPTAPQGQTFYYRVVALNFEGSAVSASQSVAIPAGTAGAGLEVNFYNNQWWRSNDQSTDAPITAGVAGLLSPTALVSDEQTVLSYVNGAGNDSGSGTLESGAATPKYPDPAGAIGPDDFSTVFTGQVNITTAGTYTFSINTDDDGYLYIDDILASSYPGAHGPGNAEVNYPLPLTAGKHDVEFFQSNGGGGWDFHMYYNGPDTSSATTLVPSSALSAVARTPVAPTTFTASAGTTGGTATLTWANNNTSAVRYVIQRSTDPNFNTNVVSFNAGLNGSPVNNGNFPATTSTTDSGLAANTTYYYRIFAQNYDATSPPATTSVAVPPPPPTGLKAILSASPTASVSLTWSAVAGAASYNVYRATSPGGEGATPVATGLTSPSYTDANVTAGGTYYYQVTSVGPAASGSLQSARSFEVVSRTSLPSTVFLSEFEAINDNALADAAGAHPDWLELYNPGNSAVNVGGYYLTDSASNLKEWQIPSVTVAANGFLVIFCDGTNQTNPAELHTNFSLSGSGGYVALVAPDGATVLTSYNYAQQQGNGSYGIAMAQSTSGGTTVTSYGAVGYLNATPNAINGPTLGTALTAQPAFDHPDGFYSAPFQLALTDATPGAQIYYTLDGSLPSTTNGTQYTGPITVGSTTAIRAVAVLPGGVPSLPNSHTFIYTSDVITQDSTGAAPPGWPTSWGTSVEHYGMDPRVVNNAAYSGEIKQDLLTLPTFSITMNLSDLFDPTTGIYSNSGQSGKAWIRPATIEYIQPSGTPGFTANVGLAIKGGASAGSPDAKHGFRVEFDSSYGQKDLTFPLFGNSGATTFKEFDLRTDQNNSWQYQDPANFIAARDQFSNATNAALGNTGQRQQTCFLYINGKFWGLFDAVDRPDADWAAATYGGKSSDYDVLKPGGGKTGFTMEVSDGTATAYDQLVTDMASLDFTNNANYMLIQGRNPDGTPNPAYPNLIDVNNLIQYMMLTYYVGNLDGPNSNFVSNNPNNFYAVRPTDGNFGFRFVPYDSEWTLLDVNQNRVNTDTSAPTNATANPADFFQKLEVNPTFKQLVADYIQKDFFNNGPLTPAASLARFNTLTSQVSGAVVPESARWGDVLRPSQPYTRNVEWQAEVNRLKNSYFPQRTAIVLSQLQAVGLVPSVSAPNFSQFGGTIPAGYPLTITNPNSGGSIYYTTDGSDPIGANNAPSATAHLYSGAIPLNTTTEVKARVLNGTTWSAVTDATFNVAAGGVRVTELNYSPAAPGVGNVTADDEEFIELKNFGAQTVNLQGANFTNGINYTFGNVTLAPGQVGVLVSNATAFAALHGQDPYIGAKILGEFQSGGKHFNNTSEQVTLVDATGQTLADFTYSNAWYPTTDGTGPTLEVVNPSAITDLNQAASWRPSPQANGTPGVDDTVPTAAPTNLAATAQNGVVSLTWTAVPGAASYNIYRGTASGGEGITPLATGVTTATTAAAFNDTTVTAGNTYYYTVAALDPGGTSPSSNEASAAVIVPVSPPSVTQQPGGQIVNVGGTATFTATATGNPPPTVQWNVSTDGGKTFSPIAGATSTTYSFAVTSAALDGNQYQAVFTNSQGSTASNAATLTAIAPALTAWNFDTSDKTGQPLPVAANTAPDPSAGAGTAASVGMALVSGPDASDIVADPGSSDTGSTNQAWRIVGNNGWSSTAPIGSQGAQFMVDTTGRTNVSLQFDVDITAQGEGKLAVEYTTDGGTTWKVAPALFTNGAAGITVATNDSSTNTIVGPYFNATGGARWYNRLTADFSSVAAANNNPKFGIRLVNAATGPDCVNASGQALNNTSGNWRFDEVDVNGATTAAAPSVTTQPTSHVATVGSAVSFTAAASGTPAPTVQWQLSTDGGQTWSPITGATSTTYSFTAASLSMSGSQYRAVFTNAQGSATTSPVTLTVVAAPFTAWNFDTSDKTNQPLPAAANTAPDPSAGAGTASSIGMALVSGPDASAILVDAGSSDGGAANANNQAWKIVGTNGWSSTAPIGSQGAQFLASTVGYSNVSVQFDVDVTAQGEGKLAVEYTTDGGATWKLAPALYTNGDAGVTVASNSTSPNTVQGPYFNVTGGGWYNRLTADFTGVPGVANNPNFGIRLVNAATGADCVNATGQPLSNTSGNWRFDEVDLNGTVAPVPAVVSVTPQDASGAATNQRSIVSQFQVVFSTPVALAPGAFTLSLVNNYGSGANDGSGNTPDTDVSQVLGTPMNPSGDGMTWIVPVVQSGASTTYSYNLAAGGASLQDGVYHLNVSASAVTASAGGTPMASPYASPLFHRLFGDTDGNKTVNALDYARFKTAFGSGTGAAGYNADLDFDNNGTINAADYAQFKKRFGTTFTYP